MKKTEQVLFALTKEEKKILEKKAEDLGLSVSAYIRYKTIYN